MDAGSAGKTTEFLMAGGDIDAMCYACLCTLNTVSDERAQVESFYAAGNIEVEPDRPNLLATFNSKLSTRLDGYCDPMAEKKSDASFWGSIATFIVVVINQVLKRGIKASAPFGKAHTVELEMVSTALRVFACQVLNTAVLMLILGSNAWVFGDLPGEHYDTVNAKWYATVGTPLVKTMMIQFATPSAMHLIMHAVGICKRSRALSKAKTQNLLNAALAPTNFEIAAAYGEILLAMTVTLLFGAGIPLLYHVAAVGFCVRYNIERWVIVKVAKKPPLYSKQLFESFDEVFALMLLVHAAMAVYFISSAGGERPSGYIFLKAPWNGMHPHVWPMFISFLCVVAGFVYKFGRCACVAERRVAKQGQEGEEKEENPPFTQAYSNGLIINEDDDYSMDQHENLIEFQDAFIHALDLARRDNMPPFDDEGFYERTKNAVAPVLGANYLSGPNDDGATRYVEAQKERKRLQREQDETDERERLEAIAEEAGNKETKDVEKAYRALVRVRKNGDSHAIKLAEGKLAAEKEAAKEARDAAEAHESAAKHAETAARAAEKVRVRARKEAEKSRRLARSVTEEAEVAVAEARVAKEQQDLEEAELELERAELAGDEDAVAVAKEQVAKELKEADAAVVQLVVERQESMEALQAIQDAAEGALARAEAELAKKQEEAQAADERKIEEEAKVDEIYLAIVEAEKSGDLDAIESAESRLAAEKATFGDAKEESPRARGEARDAAVARDEAAAELQAARDAVEKEELKKVGIENREAELKAERSAEKLQRKEDRAALREADTLIRTRSAEAQKEQAEADEASEDFKKEEREAVAAEVDLKAKKSVLKDAQKALKAAVKLDIAEDVEAAQSAVGSASEEVDSAQEVATRERQEATDAKAVREKETKEAKVAAKEQIKAENVRMSMCTFTDTVSFPRFVLTMFRVCFLSQEMAKLKKKEEKELQKIQKRQAKEMAKLKKKLAAEVRAATLTCSLLNPHLTFDLTLFCSLAFLIFRRSCSRATTRKTKRRRRKRRRALMTLTRRRVGRRVARANATVLLCTCRLVSSRWLPRPERTS